jgi:integration host factor subunit alpha
MAYEGMVYRELADRLVQESASDIFGEVFKEDTEYVFVGLNALSESEKLVDSVFEEVIQAFERGEGVKLSSFGSFLLKNKSARMGRNPKTGDLYEISTRQSVSFIASQNLKKGVKDAPEGEK